MAAAMGFAAFPMAAGLATLRTGVFARWTGIVALIGAVSFLITFLVVLDGTTNGSNFGYGFFPGRASRRVPRLQASHIPLDRDLRTSRYSRAGPTR